MALLGCKPGNNVKTQFKNCTVFLQYNKYIYRFWVTNLLNFSVCVRLIEVSAEYRFILQYIWEEKFGTEAGVRLISGFTVFLLHINLTIFTGSMNHLLCHGIL